MKVSQGVEHNGIDKSDNAGVFSCDFVSGKGKVECSLKALSRPMQVEQTNL
jgi:hypothetical protein